MRPTRPCPSCGTLLSGSRLEGFCPKCVWDTLATEDTPSPPPTSDGRKSLLNLPGHDVLEEISRGGMGIVYRARQHEPSRTVALKMLLPHQLASTTMRERFRLEARAIAALEHPAILPMYVFGEQDGMPYFTMKLASGGTLANRRESYRRQWREIAALMAGIAEAVHFAHERGILHRDLKPGNILFDEREHAYVSDFGLAKIIGNSEMPTRSGHVLGTPQFLAPEIARGNAAAATTSTDQYSLGAMLYELLTGQPPFNQEDLVALLRDICERQPKPPREIDSRIPPDLEVICLKCLSKEPDRRYPTVAAFAEDLRRWLAGEPIVARPVGNLERFCLWCRRHRLVAALAGTVAILLAALAIGSTVYAVRLGRANAEKEEQLWMARRAQARTTRLSRELGARESGILSLTRAGRLHADTELRNELVAHLPLFDVVPGTRLPTLPSGRIAPAFSPNLRDAALLTDSAIQILDLQTHSVVRSWPRDFGGNPTDFRFSPDGSILMVQTQNPGIMAFFDIKSGRELYRIREEDFGAFAADGRTIATRENQDRRQVIFHDVVAGTILRRITNGPSVNRAMAFDSGGHSHLFVVSTAATVQFWDWKSGTLLSSLKHRTPVSIVRVRNGLFALGGEEGEIELRDFWTGIHHRIEAHRDEVDGLTFSPDNRWLISCSRGGECRIWDAVTGELAGASDQVDVVRLNSDGSQAIVKSTDGLHLATIEPGRGRKVLDVRRLGPSAVRDVEFSPDGAAIAVARYDGITLFDVETGSELAWVPVPSAIACYFIDDANLMVIDRRRMRRFTRAPGRQGQREPLVESATLDLPGTGWAGSSAISEDRSWFAITQGSSVAASKLKWPPVFTRATFATIPTEIGIDTSGRWLTAAFSHGATLSVTDLQADATEAQALRASGTSRFSPDGRLLLVNSTAAHTVFRTADWQVETNIPSSSGTGGRSLGAWSRRSPHLALGRGRKPVEIWDTRRWERKFTIESPTPHNITDLAFSPDGALLAVATDVGRVEIWTLAELARFLADEGFAVDGNMQFAEPQISAVKVRVPNPIERDLHLPTDDSTPILDPAEYPPRDPAATSNQIDLSGHMNVPVAGPWPMRGSLDNTLRELPLGLQDFAGTRFDIRGIILLNSREIMPLAPTFPQAVTGIQIQQDCRKIHFLQASTYAYQSLPPQLLVARLVMHYADGATESVGLRLNEETADWWRGPNASPPARARVAWVGLNSASELTERNILLYKYTWENPRPGKTVASIDLVSALDTPALFVVGITTEP